MLAAVDEGIGNVSKASERLQMASTTLWVVVSDNGGPSDDQCGDSWVTPTHLHGVDRNVASNYPLRGKKNTVWCATANKPRAQLYYTSSSDITATLSTPLVTFEYSPRRRRRCWYVGMLV